MFILPSWLLVFSWVISKFPSKMRTLYPYITLEHHEVEDRHTNNSNRCLAGWKNSPKRPTEKHVPVILQPVTSSFRFHLRSAFFVFEITCLCFGVYASYECQIRLLLFLKDSPNVAVFEWELTAFRAPRACLTGNIFHNAVGYENKLKTTRTGSFFPAER